VSGGLDIYVALRPTSRDADLFEMPVHIVEDPSVLPIQPPAPVQEVIMARPPSAAPVPFTSAITPFAQQQRTPWPHALHPSIVVFVV
jgi:hypothetical protein